MAQNYTGLNDTQNAMLYYNYFKTFDKYMVSTEKLEMEKKQAVAVAQATASRLKLQLEQLEHARTRDSLSNAEKKAKDQQLEIDLLNQNKKISELELEKQNAQINKARTEKYILFGILGFIFLIFILLYFQFRQKKKANLLLAKKNHQLEEQKEEISMKNLSLLTLNSTLEKQRAELADKNELLEKQKSELAKKNEQIRQSIVYASKIQEAILPSQKAIMQDFPNSFIFYRPRDIVSGDFYWYSEKEGKQIIAAVDCTGHSVPGAFMSMIGNTLLNEIVNEKNILHPAQILDKLHDGIVSTLNQGRENDPKDGMDITLCVIDKKNKELEISTANHSVFIISNNNLQEIEGDIFSIGDEMLLHKKSNFTNHTVFLDQETTIYLMSDGYQDQFGGENNTKFMKFNLKKTLLSIQNLSLKEQGEFMIHTFYSWKGERQQIDDVLLIGLKIECEEE
jgi:serine phosphatase RsbU (regulator of sigma subunit)